MDRGSVLGSIQTALNAEQHIAVLSHYNPDPDAFGSSVGLSVALRSMGKEVVTINESGALPRYHYIRGAELVQKELPAGFPGILVVCDCGDLRRVGDSLVDAVSKARLVINIDHHASNTQFGHVNYVLEHASSSSELVFELLEYMGFFGHPHDSAMAAVSSGLYAGIVSDTGSFRYSNTSERTFAVAQRLVRLGVQPHVVAQNLYGNNSIASVKLHAAALSGIRTVADGKVALVTVTGHMLSEAGAVQDDTEGLVESARDISGVRVACLMRWDQNIWRVSMRSIDERHNVSVVAQNFGGGGHRVAAAFRWKREVSELEALLIPELVRVANL